MWMVKLGGPLNPIFTRSGQTHVLIAIEFCQFVVLDRRTWNITGIFDIRVGGGKNRARLKITNDGVPAKRLRLNL